MTEEINKCECQECKGWFDMPTGGGACPHCGSSYWRELNEGEN